MKNYWMFLAFLIQGNSYGQTIIESELLTTSPQGVSYIAYDAFDYCYTVNQNVFRKSKANENWEYKNVSLGKITKIDIQNPLKILLFYENFNTVILLDNQLNESQNINLSLQPVLINTTAIGLASQNQLWLYNTINQQIGNYNFLKNEYKPISIPLVTKIKYYTTDFNFFIWIDEKMEVYTCSLFGAIESLGKIPNGDQFQILNSHQILCREGQKIMLLSRQKNKSWTSTPVVLPEKRFENFYYNAQILSIFTNEGIFNFKIILP